jgi:hypothetical protein
VRHPRGYTGSVTLIGDEAHLPCAADPQFKLKSLLAA